MKKNYHHKINIHYIHNIKDDKSVMKINKLKYYVTNTYNICFKDYFCEWSGNYKGLPHVTEATMLRIFIPELLKCEKTLYLDIDIIVNMNLKDIYNIDCGEKGISLKSSINEKWKKLTGKTSGNCGVMMMDLETLRKNNFVEKCLKIHSETNEHDQYIINVYCDGNHGILEPHQNIFLNQDDYLVENHKDYILHYAGPLKPYFHNTGKYQYIWDQFIPNKYLTDKINFGVIIYNNDCHRYASSNIGDYIQSLAAINIYKKIIEMINNVNYEIEDFLETMMKNNIPNFNFVFIKRDNIEDSQSFFHLKNIITIMNGWWLQPCDEDSNIMFHIPKNIKPIFTSFHISNQKLLNQKNIKILKKNEPIGCRDISTFETLKSKNIECYFSGCLTTTIDFYKWKNLSNITYFVDTVPNLKEFEYISHCNKRFKNIKHDEGMFIALRMLKKYSESKNVITSRLNCYIPCLAMDVPVEFISPSGDKNISTWGSKNRFEGLKNLSKDSTELNKMSKNLNKTLIFNIMTNIFKHVQNIGKLNIGNKIIYYNEEKKI